MRQRLWKLFRMSLVCTILAGTLLLYIPSAKGDMLLFATTEDCEAAPVSDWETEEPHAVVLQKAGKAKQKAARQALEKAGISDVVFLEFASIKSKNRTPETLKKKWLTKENIAKVASQLRRHKDDRIIYFSAGKNEHSFLSSFADKCAQGANDPDCQKEKKPTDEYLYEVGKLIDGATNEERDATPADTSWKAVWEDKQKYDLSELPETDDEGFLPEGEYVLKDSKQGLWVYLSPTLRVVITKHSKNSCSWFEADITRKPEGETLHVVTNESGHGSDPTKVAKQNRLVVGINTDYYLLRVSYKKKVGLVFRKGEMIRESVGETTGTWLPPLDNLLLDGEGGFLVEKAGVLDSAKAKELGAVDVLAFGPVLIKDGRIRALTLTYRKAKEPRTAVGQLGKNHYLMIVAEGRLTSSRGMSLDQLAKLMAARGCTDAFNLDGGRTSALIFMGERLNKIGNMSMSGTVGPRSITELLGIGTYEE